MKSLYCDCSETPMDIIHAEEKQLQMALEKIVPKIQKSLNLFIQATGIKVYGIHIPVLDVTTLDGPVEMIVGQISIEKVFR